MRQRSAGVNLHTSFAKCDVCIPPLLPVVMPPLPPLPRGGQGTASATNDRKTSALGRSRALVEDLIPRELLQFPPLAIASLNTRLGTTSPLSTKVKENETDLTKKKTKKTGKTDAVSDLLLSNHFTPPKLKFDPLRLNRSYEGPSGSTWAASRDARLVKAQIEQKRRAGTLYDDVLEGWSFHQKYPKGLSPISVEGDDLHWREVARRAAAETIGIKPPSQKAIPSVLPTATAATLPLQPSLNAATDIAAWMSITQHSSGKLSEYGTNAGGMRFTTAANVFVHSHTQRSMARFDERLELATTNGNLNIYAKVPYTIGCDAAPSKEGPAVCVAFCRILVEESSLKPTHPNAVPGGGETFAGVTLERYQDLVYKAMLTSVAKGTDCFEALSKARDERRREAAEEEAHHHRAAEEGGASPPPRLVNNDTDADEDVCGDVPLYGDDDERVINGIPADALGGGFERIHRRSDVFRRWERGSGAPEMPNATLDEGELSRMNDQKTGTRQTNSSGDVVYEARNTFTLSLPREHIPLGGYGDRTGAEKAYAYNLLLRGTEALATIKEIRQEACALRSQAKHNAVQGRAGGELPTTTRAAAAAATRVPSYFETANKGLVELVDPLPYISVLPPIPTRFRLPEVGARDVSYYGLFPRGSSHAHSVSKKGSGSESSEYGFQKWHGLGKEDIKKRLDRGEGVQVALRKSALNSFERRIMGTGESEIKSFEKRSKNLGESQSSGKFEVDRPQTHRKLTNASAEDLQSRVTFIDDKLPPRYAFLRDLKHELFCDNDSCETEKKGEASSAHGQPHTNPLPNAHTQAKSERGSLKNLIKRLVRDSALNQQAPLIVTVPFVTASPVPASTLDSLLAAEGQLSRDDDETHQNTKDEVESLIRKVQEDSLASVREKHIFPDNNSNNNAPSLFCSSEDPAAAVVRAQKRLYPNIDVTQQKPLSPPMFQTAHNASPPKIFSAAEEPKRPRRYFLHFGSIAIINPRFTEASNEDYALMSGLTAAAKDTMRYVAAVMGEGEDGARNQWSQLLRTWEIKRVITKLNENALLRQVLEDHQRLSARQRRAKGRKTQRRLSPIYALVNYRKHLDDVTSSRRREVFKTYASGGGGALGGDQPTLNEEERLKRAIQRGVLPWRYLHSREWRIAVKWRGKKQSRYAYPKLDSLADDDGRQNADSYIRLGYRNQGHDASNWRRVVWMLLSYRRSQMPASRNVTRDGTLELNSPLILVNGRVAPIELTKLVKDMIVSGSMSQNRQAGVCAAMPHGHRVSYSVAAAKTIAEVTRDALADYSRAVLEAEEAGLFAKSDSVPLPIPAALDEEQERSASDNRAKTPKTKGSGRKSKKGSSLPAAGCLGCLSSPPTPSPSQTDAEATAVVGGAASSSSSSAIDEDEELHMLLVGDSSPAQAEYNKSAAALAEKLKFVDGVEPVPLRIVKQTNDGYHYRDLVTAKQIAKSLDKQVDEEGNIEGTKKKEPLRRRTKLSHTYPLAPNEAVHHSRIETLLFPE